MKHFPLIVALVIAVSGAAIADDTEAVTPADPHAGKQLVFHDDFDSNKLDRTVWKIHKGDGCPRLCGFGNKEEQRYSAKPQNLRIEDGKLILEAHYQKKRFTSAKISSEKIKGWRHGRIEIRAKVASGIGTWTSFWMLSDDDSYGVWPKSGMIDILGHPGYAPGVLRASVHTDAFNSMSGNLPTSAIRVKTAPEKFYTYSIDWSENEINWYVEDHKYFSFKRSDDATWKEWPFDKPFHLIMNLAVGGVVGGEYGVDVTSFPARVEIDWVKVWQNAKP